MVLHAGIYYFTGPVVLYDTVTKETTKLEIEKRRWQIEDADEIFNFIKRQVTEKLGCACFCLSNGKTNEERNTLINAALKVGFEKVRIIDGHDAFYLSVISQIPYKPAEGDVIWLYTGAKWYTWYIKNKKATIISAINVKYSESELTMVLQKIGTERIPNVVLYNDGRDFDSSFVNELFPKCFIFSYKQGNYLGKQFQSMQTYIYPEYCVGALVKARIMGKDPDAIKCNISAILTRKFCVFINADEQLMSFDEGEKLAATKTIIIKTQENYNILKIIPYNSRKRYIYCLQINKIYSFTLTLEKNGIFDIDLKLQESQNETTAENTYFFPRTVKIPHIPRKAYTVGVNLGNMRCCASVIRRDGIHAVALDNTGERLLPCYVGYDENHDKCGNIVINRFQKQLATANPQLSTVYDVKRIMGKKLDEIKKDPNWPFEIVKNGTVKLDHLTDNELFQYQLLENYNIFIKMKRNNEDLFKHPEEILAVLLKQIRQKVDEFQGLQHSNIMITIPYSFTDSQKTSTCAAAVFAGWENISLMPEPIAAVVNHLANKPQTESQPKTVNAMIFDMGGKTLNVFVLKCTEDEIKIISHTENSILGGENFDYVLVDYFHSKLFNIINPKNLIRKRYKLFLECQKIKEHLSEHNDCSLDVDEVFFPSEEFIEITRLIFEELSENLIKEVQICILDCLRKSTLTTEEIDDVILVGGGSRMPMIQTMLKDIFPNARQHCGNNPNEVIAKGATQYSNYLDNIKNKYVNTTSVKTSENTEPPLDLTNMRQLEPVLTVPTSIKLVISNI